MLVVEDWDARLRIARALGGSVAVSTAARAIRHVPRIADQMRPESKPWMTSMIMTLRPSRGAPGTQLPENFPRFCGDSTASGELPGEGSRTTSGRSSPSLTP